LAAGLGLVLLVVAGLLWGRPVYEFLSNREQIAAWAAGFGPWAPVAITALEFGQTIVAPLPGTGIEAVSGYLFGPWLGTLYAMIGISLGSWLNFVLARWFGRPLLLKIVPQESVARLDDLAEQGGPLLFFLLWIVPFVPDDLVCLAAGLTPMPTPQFLVLMILGRLPGIFVANWLGDRATELSPGLWLALIALMAGLAAIAWRWGDTIQEAVMDLVRRLAHHLE
jgi:uncharacterized membrane protein YdjX (TVP38/TMEM64 family)